MGIINWARSRFNGSSTVASKPERCHVDVPEQWRSCFAPVPEETEEQQQWRCRQDQAAGFLCIGTLGNIVHEATQKDHPVHASTLDMPEFTIEEAEKLHVALGKLLRRTRSKSDARGAKDGPGLPLDRFLNCPSSLEVDRRVNVKQDEKDNIEGHGDLSPNTKIILSMARDLLVNTGNSSGSGIKNRSFKFLLRKIFVWDDGVAPPSRSLKDPVESRMDKFLRTVIGKKINVRVRPSSTPAATRFCLEDRTNWKSGHSRLEVDGEEDVSSRWDRTGSEFIVLEI